ncbi:MAG: riboflavin biosynthesis protein RibF [Deltaproteobacteria bacterium]|jgi:riboflavin kinase/FMN adenylyltransferase|nr:riboflavin biosynthesis protein RibF [Deltaproteobacteria bacterium]
MLIERNWLGSVPVHRPKVAMTVGVFDGLHLGHRHLIDRVMARARALGLRSLVLTFDPHPISVLSPKSDPEILTTFDQKAAILEGLGLDILGRLEFNQKLSALTAEEFLTDAIWSRVEPFEFVIGPDFRFGRNAEGHLGQIKAWAKGHKIRVTEVKLQKGQDVTYSSSHIRALLKIGLVDAAAVSLGRPYRLSGRVVEGSHRGRDLGFPTANLGEVRQLIPGPGVYAVKAGLLGRSFNGMASIGHNPTFGGRYLTVETFVFDFDRDVYGERMDVDFIAQMRGMIRFDGPDKLAERLRADERQARGILGKLDGEN